MLAAVVSLAAAYDARAALAVATGDKIVFLGDSITRFGKAPVGWVTLVIDGLARAGVKAEAVNAGIPGDRSADCLARLPPLLALKPAWLLVSCGVNDVYRGAQGQGIPLDAYRSNLRAIVVRAQAAGIRVMLLTPTMIGEDPTAPGNRTLEEYDAAVRQLARDQQCLLADVAADMQRELARLERAGGRRGNLLTVSGAHLNARGNMMMANVVLRTFGMDDASLQRAEQAWLDIPGAETLNVPLTLRQLDALTARAGRRNTTPQRLLQPTLEKSVADFLAH